MKIALLNDTHFGCRNDSPAFIEYQNKFYNDIFFPYLVENNIKTSSKSFRIGSVRYLTGKEADNVKLQMKLWLKENYTKNDEIRAIGTGGSINKLYNISKHDFNAPMTYQSLCNIIDHIANYNYEDRIRILKLKPDRADVIIHASKIYISCMEWSGAKKIIVPQSGLADGIVNKLYNEYVNGINVS